MSNLMKRWNGTWMLAFVFSVSGYSQGDWYDCSKPFPAPDGKHMLICTLAAGEIAECPVTVLGLKGPGMADSIVISRTACHDCRPPRFYWLESQPVLIAETNQGDCEGTRYVQFIPLDSPSQIIAVRGEAVVLDEPAGMLIICREKIEQAASGAIMGHRYQLFSYDWKAKKETRIYSASAKYKMWEWHEPPVVQRETGVERALRIKFQNNRTPNNVLVRY